jgi:hypothetical protein
MKNLWKIILMAGLVGFACERDGNTLGPDLSDLYGDFKLLEDFTASASSVNFAGGENLYFTARFSKTVDWQIRIVGRSSGATKILEGKSKSVDELNSIWNGTTTILPMFKMETCDAFLAIDEEVYYDTIYGIVIDSTRVNEGFLLSDFEDGVNPNWNTFFQTGADMKFTVIESDSSAQGRQYYKMGGAVSWDWLIGLIDMRAGDYGEDHYPLSEIADEVYFNFFLDKPQDISNEVILFQFMEDDNEDGIFQASSEDMWSLELKNIPANWNTYSIKYSDLVCLVNGAPSTPAGNALHEPHKLLQVSLLFLASPSSGYSETDIDYMIFTEGQALEP